MRYQHVGVAAMAVVACGAAEVRAVSAQSPAPTLSILQLMIKDVAPPVEVDASGEERLEVLAWVDRPDSAYARGERVRMFVRTNRDAYVTILNVDPAGETTVLFPNRYQSDNRVRAARAVEIPAPGSGSQVVVRGPVGTELLKVIASTEPVPLFEAMQMADIGAFRRLRAEPQGIARDLVLAFGDTRSSAGSAPAHETAATEWAVCHQTIATIPTPTAAEQRTRSLQVLRTQDDGDSVTCNETP